MRSRSVLKSLALFMVLASSFAWGAGFALYEGSARGMAMGGLSGSANDPAAIFYNPAGITQLEGKHFMGGLALIKPFADLTTKSIYETNSTTTSYEVNVFPPPHVYATYQFSDKLWFGAGVFSRFGLGSEFKKDWVGRYNSTNAVIQSLTFNPNVAWKVNERLSLAFGVDFTYIDVQLERYNDAGVLLGYTPNDPRTSDLDVFQKVTGDHIGFGYNLALHTKLTDKLSLGVVYNAETKEKINNGVIRFTKPSAALPETWYVDAKGKAEINLPAMLSIGFAYNYSDSFKIELGGIRTGWSSYKELTLKFEQPILVIPGLGVSIDSSTSEKNWEDVWRYNIGFENRIGENTRLMWGWIYDETPIPDETVDYLAPTNDRLLWDIGISHNFGQWVMDATYSYLGIKKRHIEQRQLRDGVLETDVEGGAHLVGLSFSRKF